MSSDMGSIFDPKIRGGAVFAPFGKFEES